MGNDLVTGNSTIVKPVNINAGITFTLLGTSFTAVFEKTAKQIQFILLPTPGQEDKSFTIQEICDGINDQLKQWSGGTDNPVKTSDVTDQMKDYMSADKKDPTFLSNYRVKLNEIFLYITKDLGDSPLTTVEYAFSISINKDDADLGFQFISLDSVFVNIWNTERANILSKMTMGDIQKLLAA
ncbi:hypothetical protein H0486_11995 [Lachnospiraceae bacterium MD1]|uniref:Uncharacterized protein n=1 Tax=Variimorphobacter saccharofermentans TaxID=2755051 RepID=A0A839K2J3_9FIRM|nr:hypothetical protein [Variimorphobacter saccharofermentans]MBB2183597.1 hypothetical protein [Variimorphobacter saccharofermentans]